MTAPFVIAIDPGPTTTGIVVRWRDELLAHGIADRGERHDLVDYGRHILDVAVDTADLAWRRWHERHHGDPSDQLWAIEDYNTPTPHLGQIAPQQIAETAWLVGWLYAALCEEQTDGPQPSCVERTLLVPPAGHGRQPYLAYPDVLITNGERRPRGWRYRPAGRSTPVSHCRSAWDIAGAAAQQHRTRPQRTA